MEIHKQYVNQQLLNGDIMEYNYNMEYICISYHIGIMELKRDSSKQQLYNLWQFERGPPNDDRSFCTWVILRKDMGDDSLALQKP